ncbi:hypothetical protein BH09ACT6_BH09ACT6_01660 [soil metagenome]
MMFALVAVIAAVWIIVSLPIALIIGRIPRIAERAEMQHIPPLASGAVGSITR